MDVHPAERISRYYASIGKRVAFDFESDCEHGFFVRVMQKGSRKSFVENPVTKLNSCEICGRTSTPKKVHVRNDVYGWAREGRNDFVTQPIDMLCMGCWNRVRAVIRNIHEAEDCRRLFNKLTRSIRDERRNRNES